MNTKGFDRIIKDTHSSLRDIPSGNGGNSNDRNHPSNWTDDQYITFTKRWIQELAHMTSWRDNSKAGPPFNADSKRIEKLAGFPEQFLQQCLRYQTTIEIEVWLKLTPEQRYKRAKQEWSNHNCSVHKRYGNTYPSPQKPGCSHPQDGGCIEECIYYLDTGTIADSEVLGWYGNIIGDRTYAQLKCENNDFLREFVDYLKKQAQELPTNPPYQKDYFESYYPSIMDI